MPAWSPGSSPPFEGVDATAGTVARKAPHERRGKPPRSDVAARQGILSPAAQEVSRTHVDFKHLGRPIRPEYGSAPFTPPLEVGAQARTSRPAARDPIYKRRMCR